MIAKPIIRAEAERLFAAFRAAGAVPVDADLLLPAGAAAAAGRVVRTHNAACQADDETFVRAATRHMPGKRGAFQAEKRRSVKLYRPPRVERSIQANFS